ncbi:hypothetical protein D9757_006602 [Collybiopsis confluens]|nr:hypothetical protein D9757_006602 [Collybiopsis confluens]
MLAAAREFPVYLLDVKEKRIHSDGGKNPVRVDLTIQCGVTEETTKFKKPKGRTSHMTSVLTLTSDNRFVDFRRISTKSLKETKTFEITATLEKPSQSIVIYIASEACAGATVIKSIKPKVAPSEFPTLNTKPITSLERELQELENVEGLFDMHVDENGELIDAEEEEPKPKPVAFKDLRKTNNGMCFKKLQESSKKRNLESVSGSTSMDHRKLPHGNYECNHSCKDKQACRHLCCREGLAEPPKSKSYKGSNKPAAEQSSLDDFASEAPSRFKARPKPKPRTKTDHALDDLENLHQNTNVQKNLKLAQGHRIKLGPSPGVTSNRKKRPAPDFNIKFATLGSPPDDVENSDLPRNLDDDNFPAPHEIISSSKKKRSYDSEEDYFDSELDALIGGLPPDDLGSAPVPIMNHIGLRPAKKKAKMDHGGSKEKSMNSLSSTAPRRPETSIFIPESEDSDRMLPGIIEVDSDDEVEFVDDNTTPFKNDDSTFDLHNYNTTPGTPDLTISMRSFEYDEVDELKDDLTADKDVSVAQFSFSGPLSLPRPSLYQLKDAGMTTDAASNNKTGVTNTMVPAQELSAPKERVFESRMVMEDEDDEFARLEAWLDAHTV